MTALVFFYHSAHAEVVYVPSNTHRVYIGPDPYAQLGQALGNLFVAMNQRSQQQATQREYEKSRQLLQNAVNENAKSETSSMSIIISEFGLDYLWNEFDNIVFSLGVAPYKNVSNGIVTMSLSHNVLPEIQVIREYT